MHYSRGRMAASNFKFSKAGAPKVGKSGAKWKNCKWQTTSTKSCLILGCRFVIMTREMHVRSAKGHRWLPHTRAHTFTPSTQTQDKSQSTKSARPPPSPKHTYRCRDLDVMCARTEVHVCMCARLCLYVWKEIDDVTDCAALTPKQQYRRRQTLFETPVRLRRGFDNDNKRCGSPSQRTHAHTRRDTTSFTHAHTRTHTDTQGTLGSTGLWMDVLEAIVGF